MEGGIRCSTFSVAFPPPTPFGVPHWIGGGYPLGPVGILVGSNQFFFDCGAKAQNALLLLSLIQSHCSSTTELSSGYIPPHLWVLCAAAAGLIGERFSLLPPSSAAAEPVARDVARKPIPPRFEQHLYLFCLIALEKDFLDHPEYYYFVLGQVPRA